MSQLQETYAQARQELYDQMCQKYNMDDQEDRDKAFKWICHNGCTILANMFLDIYPDIVVNDNNLFVACLRGNLDMLQWLFYTFPNTTVNIFELMGESCNRGYLHIIQWLADKFPETDVHADEDVLLRIACGNGCEPIVKWLLHGCPSISTDIFKVACEYPHIVERLLEYSPDIDIHADDFVALRSMSPNGLDLTLNMLIEYTKDTDISYHIYCQHYIDNPAIMYIVSRHPIKTQHYNETPVLDRYVYILRNINCTEMVVSHVKARLLHDAIIASRKSAAK